MKKTSCKQFNNSAKWIINICCCFIIFFISPQNVVARQLSISIDVDTSVETQAFLHGYYIDQKILIDSIRGSNPIVFGLHDTIEAGLYNIMLYSNLKDKEGNYQRMGFDVILDSSHDVSIKIALQKDGQFGAISAISGENFAYYQHFNNELQAEQRLVAVNNMLKEYPLGDDFYAKIIKQANKLESTINMQSQGITEKAKYPMAEYYFQSIQKLKKASIDGVDFTNPWLKHSSVLSKLVRSYLYQQDQESISNVEKIEEVKLKLAALLTKLRDDTEVYDAMLITIVKDFEKRGENEITLFLNEEYILPTICENESLTDELLIKNQKLKKLSYGKLAPNIDFQKGAKFKNLHEIDAEYTLLIFWETSCYHCQNLTDALQLFYEELPRDYLEIVASSMDSSKKDYATYLSTHNFTWIEHTEFKGWQSDAANNYNVLSAPSMFLLDKDKKIMAQPLSVIEVAAIILKKE